MVKKNLISHWDFCGEKKIKYFVNLVLSIFLQKLGNEHNTKKFYIIYTKYKKIKLLRNRI